MDTTADAPQESPFGRFGRFLGSTKTGRVLVSIGILALFSIAAYAAWHDREMAAYILTAWLVIYGLQMAWNLLPIPEATRTRWRQNKQIAARCSASNYRVMLWVGIAVALSEWMPHGRNTTHDFFEYIIPGAFVISGAVSYILCYRFVRHERNISQNAPEAI